jgi:hypothetical protein
MGKKIVIIMGALVILLGITGFIVYRSLTKPIPQITENTNETETVAQVDSSVKLNVTWSKTKDNTISLSVSGLSGKMNTLSYELSYESKGLIKGVNSGSKPIDVIGEDGFDRDVYLGTCSKNVCTPDIGITKVTAAIEFIDSAGKKYQSSKDFTL